MPSGDSECICDFATGLEKIMIFFKIKKSDFFDLNQIFLYKQYKGTKIVQMLYDDVINDKIM